MAKTMIETYGSDYTGFSEGGFVWAAEATVNILAPRANFIGSYYRGTINYGQLYDKDTATVPSTAISVQELINISENIDIMEPQFHLRTGIVNHDLIYDSQKQKQDNLSNTSFVGELINYIIL